MMVETAVIHNKNSQRIYLDFLDQRSLDKYARKYPEIMGNDEFINWIVKLRTQAKNGFSMKRFSQCVSIVNQFQKFANIGISEWLDLSEEWGKKKFREAGENPATVLLAQFRDSLIDPVKNNRGSVNARVNLLKSLHTHTLGVELKMKADTNETTVKDRRAQTREEIQLVVNALPKLVDKAVKICLVQSGASLSDVVGKNRLYYTPELKHKLDEGVPFVIQKNRTKNNQRYFMPFSMEMISAIRHAITEYEHKTGAPKPLNQALFVDPKISATGELILEDYTPNAYRSVLKRVSKNIGLSTDHITAQSDRRFFKTAMMNAGMPVPVVEAFLGHKLGLEGNYFTDLHDPDAMLAHYLEHCHAVMLGASEETARLKKSLEDRDEAIQRLDARIEAYDQNIASFAQSVARFNEIIQKNQSDLETHKSVLSDLLEIVALQARGHFDEAFVNALLTGALKKLAKN